MARPSGVKLGYSSQPLSKVMRRVPATVTAAGGLSRGRGARPSHAQAPTAPMSTVAPASP